MMEKVLIIGSGALKIGEAGEFDYSGSQALKALKEEGINTILINPNIATVQTSHEIADKIYFLPITKYFVEKIIEKERPDGLLLAFGGQTALNVGVELYKSGVLEKNGVKVLGTPIDAIILTEDRQLFADKLRKIDIKTPKSVAANNMQQLLEAAQTIGFPVIVRSAFTLGGQGSGFCYNNDDLVKIAEKAFSYSSQLLVEESLKGWKEIEYEVVRDRYDNCITVCNMENFDPLGIHTGESIVVAPSQTLSNSEYHKLRQIAIKIVRNIGIVGECNVQFALDTSSDDYRVIEVNARLSRSSALASKATGYPLAFIAAKLALGHGLHQLKNSVTKTTPAFFEPALDYVVCKIPRWDLTKFSGVTRELGSSMKSVGEIMAIGRSFEEAIQKGLRMVGLGMHGFTANSNNPFVGQNIEELLSKPTDLRIFAIAEAFKLGFSPEKINKLTGIDIWFLNKLMNIINIEKQLENFDNYSDLPDDLLIKAKKNGFSDFQIVRIVNNPPDNMIDSVAWNFRKYRINKNIKPFVKQIDTLAAEYPAQTNYLYLTYHADEHDITFDAKNKTVIVLGSGAYRIGSSVEFDWASVSAVNQLKKNNFSAVIINYNPETVSTDYDITDRLYFDELSFERVADIAELENPFGIIVSMGGQIPNNLAIRLHKRNFKILGTSPLSIDRAEDRHKFSSMLDSLNIDQPKWRMLTDMNSVFDFVNEVGFPVIIRPSYVLSGAAMNVVSNKQELSHFLNIAAKVSKEHPVVVSQFIQQAKEIEFDAVAQDGEIKFYAISEHIEFAGVHSGDATLVFPPQKVYLETIRRIKIIAKKIAKELNITGPFNIQFLAKDNNIKVIECNLRASRSFPFVSKIINENFAELATKAMLGITIEKPDKSIFDIEHIGVKASQFSFARLSKADPVLGVDMASTGEVGCIADSYYEAILKAMLSVGYKIPKKGVLLSTGNIRSKIELLKSAEMMQKKGIKLYATRGTAEFLSKHGINAKILYWPDSGKSPNTIEYMKHGMIDLVVNIPKNLESDELYNDYTIRRTAIDLNIPLITNARLASAFIYAFCLYDIKQLQIKAWDEFYFDN